MTLLYGLVAFEQIRFHKIDGHRHVASDALEWRRTQHETRDGVAHGRDADSVASVHQKLSA